MNKKITFLVLFVFFIINSLMFSSEKITFIIDKSKNGICYKLNNKQIQLEKIFDFFIKYTDEEIEKSHVFILINEDVTFSSLNNLTGILAKIGFFDTRCFIFYKNRKMMIEMFYARKAIPFPEDKFEM